MNNLKFSKNDIKKARDELKFSPKFKQLKALNILSRTASAATICGMLAYAFAFFMLIGFIITIINIESSIAGIFFVIPALLLMGDLVCAILACAVMIVLIILSWISTSNVVKQIKNGEWNAYEIFRYNYLVRIARVSSRKLILAGVILYAVPLALIPVAVVMALTDFFSYLLANKIFYAGIEQANNEGILTPEEVQYYSSHGPDYLKELATSSQIYTRVERFYSQKQFTENKY